MEAFAQLRDVAARLTLCAGLVCTSACQDPPSSQVRVPPPVHENDEAASTLKQAAYREALEEALDPARAALIAADPLAAYQAGHSPAASPPLQVGERMQLRKLADPARSSLDELSEDYLPGPEVVILRVLRFAFSRVNDDLRRRSPARDDAMVGLHDISRYVDELRYRLLQDDCDAACEVLATALAADVAALRQRLGSSSSAGTQHAINESRRLSQQLRGLAQVDFVAARSELGATLEALAAALDAHRGWLESVALALPRAPVRAWTAPAIERDTLAPEEVLRQGDIVGESALIRRMSVEERIDLMPARAYTEVERHVKRWEVLRSELVGSQDLSEASPAPVDLARCGATLARVRTGLEGVEQLDAPRFDCPRYVSLLRAEPASEGASAASPEPAAAGGLRSDSQLLLDIIDDGVIEPQRRILRSAELPELALVSGRWSMQVHTHLRRVMVLANLKEPAAMAAALDAGRRALCLAAAGLWIHGQLGPPHEVDLSLGKACADLGDATTISALVLGDPRGSLAGFGLSLIGDEPARMVGFDRFYWAPLGLMKILATPTGMHPDAFTLPDDPPTAPEPEVELKVEQL